CLLKIGMIGIQDDWVSFPECIPENLLVDSIPKLAFLRKTFDQAIVFDIVIDLEMRCFVNFEFEVFVSNLVLTKVLRIGFETEKQRAGKEKQNCSVFTAGENLVKFIHDQSTGGID